MDTFSEKVLNVTRLCFDIGEIFSDKKIIEFVKAEFTVEDIFPEAVENLQDQIDDQSEKIEELQRVIALLQEKVDNANNPDSL